MESCADREGVKGHIITSAVEHVAVKETCKYMCTRGYTVTYVDVDPFGRATPEAVLAAVTPNTRLITLMLANVGVSSLIA